jgi:hypothetical protein
MNKKGFAITSILYGLLIMVLIIIMGTLSILSKEKAMMEELIDGTSGANKNVKLSFTSLNDGDFTSDIFIPDVKGLYEYNNCKLYILGGESVPKSDFDMNATDSKCIQ